MQSNKDIGKHVDIHELDRIVPDCIRSTGNDEKIGRKSIPHASRAIALSNILNAWSSIGWRHERGTLSRYSNGANEGSGLVDPPRSDESEPEDERCSRPSDRGGYGNCGVFLGGSRLARAPGLLCERIAASRARLVRAQV